MPRVVPSNVDLRRLRSADPMLAAAMRRVPRYPGFPDRAAGGYRSHFHALARSIVYQQLAGAAARTIHDRVCALTPRGAFPTPAQFLALTDDALRGAGLSRGKLAAIRDLASRVEHDGLDLARVARRRDDEVIRALSDVRGIGEWTAQMFLMFRLGRLDVMPATDLGVREGLRRLDRLAERPAPREVLLRAESWRPLRSVASWVLWRLCDLPP